MICRLWASHSCIMNANIKSILGMALHLLDIISQNDLQKLQDTFAKVGAIVQNMLVEWHDGRLVQLSMYVDITGRPYRKAH